MQDIPCPASDGKGQRKYDILYVFFLIKNLYFREKEVSDKSSKGIVIVQRCKRKA